NHHVIHGARSIAVTLSLEGITKTYPAELIDEAPNLDFAVLKIVANGDVFTPARIGVSSAMSVGDEVLAIGSPFGLQQTVTAGIVSNTRRTLTVGSRTFRNFIQTDTSINPGSSGGPLVNIKGEVIGLTTAIYSPTQAFSGIGFASPIDPAKAAFPEFIDVTSNALGNFKANIPNWARGPALKNAAQIQRGQGLNPWCPPAGRTQQMANTTIQQGQGFYPWCPPGTGVQQIANTRNRPWLGIHVNGVNKQSRKFLGLPMAYGAVVMQVFNNSPCMKAGLQRGDVIFRADNRSVKDASMLESLFGEKIIGDKIKLTAYRDGKKMTFDVELLARQQGVVPQAMPVALPAAGLPNPQNMQLPGLTGALQGGEVGAGEIEALGMEVVELSPVLATTIGIPKGITGLVVAESTLQAAAAGLLANDVIEGVNGRRVETLADFVKTMNKASLTNGISLGVYRQGQRLNLMLSG
ncbi:MAG: PDZ domain-containing protein, partial [Planctomycetota bacterium]